MELDLSVAHRLPILYREALDAVAKLERAGQRRAAAPLRREVQETYALRWDEEACRHMETLTARALELGQPAHPPKGAFRLRPVWLARR